MKMKNSPIEGAAPHWPRQASGHPQIGHNLGLPGQKNWWPGGDALSSNNLRHA